MEHCTGHPGSFYEDEMLTQCQNHFFHSRSNKRLKKMTNQIINAEQLNESIQAAQSTIANLIPHFYLSFTPANCPNSGDVSFFSLNPFDHISTDDDDWLYRPKYNGFSIGYRGGDFFLGLLSTTSMHLVSYNLFTKLNPPNELGSIKYYLKMGLYGSILCTPISYSLDYYRFKRAHPKKKCEFSMSPMLKYFATNVPYCALHSFASHLKLLDSYSSLPSIGMAFIRAFQFKFIPPAIIRQLP